jgi:ATP-dependent helicase Lhr and Lhr-like helicase
VQAGSPEFVRNFRSRLSAGAGAQGRWSLVESRIAGNSDMTVWAAVMSRQLLARYGIVSREAAVAENLPGGYSSAYPVLRAMEEAGHVRRGMFVSGMGAAQFALPAAVDMLRSSRHAQDAAESVALAASDPANPYGTLLPWPRENEDTPHGLARTSGATVILVDGGLAAFVRRRNPAIRVFLPEDDPERSTVARALAHKLAELAAKRQAGRYGLLVGEINGEPAREHPLASFLKDAGFVDTALGFQMRRGTPVPISTLADDETDMDDEPAETA